MKKTMFRRIIKYYQPLSTVSTVCNLCNKSTSKVHKNVKLDLLFSSSTKRYFGITSLLQVSQQNPKVQNSEENDVKDINSKEIDKSEQNAKDKVEKASLEINNETNEKSKQNAEQSETNEGNKTSDDEKRKRLKRESIFGSEIILHSFANTKRKEKETYLEILRKYEGQAGRKRDRVPFIYAALKFMKEFGVEKDLSVYKALIDIFPKQVMVPTNQFQTLFMHYPKEQYCCTSILEQMEDNGVIPDPEMEDLLLNIFGRHGMPLEKYWGMMYWMPKFKNLNPWPVPKPIPNDPYILAELALQKISSVDVNSKISTFDTTDVEDSIDKTWIVSAMAPIQSELIEKHDKKVPIYVEGPFRIYVATKSVDYFTLRADPPLNQKYPDWNKDDVDKIRNPYLEMKSTEVILPPSVHEQIDATIFANCATGTSTKDSLLSWIRCLQKTNPALSEIPIVFTLRNYSENEKLYIASDEKQQVSAGNSNKDSDEKIL